MKEAHISLLSCSTVSGNSVCDSSSNTDAVVVTAVFFL